MSTCWHSSSDLLSWLPRQLASSSASDELSLLAINGKTKVRRDQFPLALWRKLTGEKNSSFQIFFKGGSKVSGFDCSAVVEHSPFNLEATGLNPAY